MLMVLLPERREMWQAPVQGALILQVAQGMAAHIETRDILLPLQTEVPTLQAAVTGAPTHQVAAAEVPTHQVAVAGVPTQAEAAVGEVLSQVEAVVVEVPSQEVATAAVVTAAVVIAIVEDVDNRV